MCFVLLWVTVDPESVPGMQRVRREYPRDVIVVRHRAPFTPRSNVQSPVHLLTCWWRVGGNQRTQRICADLITFYTVSLLTEHFIKSQIKKMSIKCDVLSIYSYLLCCLTSMLQVLICVVADINSLSSPAPSQLIYIYIYVYYVYMNLCIN